MAAMETFLKVKKMNRNGEWLKSDVEEFKNLCTPLVEWLQKKGDSSETVIITDHYAKILSDEIGVPFELPDDY